MRTPLSLLLVLFFAAPALAGPSPLGAAIDHAVVERLDDGDVAAPARSFDAPLRLVLPRLPYDAGQQSLDLRMGEAGPTSLALRVDLSVLFTAYVTADLSAELPRLDAVDGDTYFAPGLEFHVTPGLSLFLEDFQPASAVVGGGREEEEVWIPQRSWDGHQISVGARLAVSEQVDLQAAAVVYTLSPSQRRSSLGASVAVTVRY